MRMRTVASSNLRAGDVFRLVDPPEDVVGEVFWKHPSTKRVKRLRQKKGETVFTEIYDLATSVFLMTDFKRARVKVIANFKPQHKNERFWLPH